MRLTEIKLNICYRYKLSELFYTIFKFNKHSYFICFVRYNNRYNNLIFIYCAIHNQKYSQNINHQLIKKYYICG